MLIWVKCAWCRRILDVKEGELPSPFNISHSICPECAGRWQLRTATPSATWDGIERRNGSDRRRHERRESTRYTEGTLIVLDGITWIDNEGTDRRRRVRREADLMRVGELLYNTLAR